MAHNFNDNTRNQKSTWQRARHSEPSKSPRQPSITPPPLPPNDEERVQFGADFIPFDIEFRVGEEIPRKRKIDAIESLESAPKPPKIARYEDGTFTMPWLNGFNFNESNVSKLFHREVMAFGDYISPTNSEHALRGLMIDEIQLITRRLWPDAVVHAFGSYATKLYLPTGDIDLVIQTSRVSDSRGGRIDALKALARLLRNCGIVKRNQVQVITARVPIVKFISVHADISIDISLNQMTGLETVQLINKYLKQFPALRPLIMSIKAFFNQRGMNEVFKGGLGSYSIICMAISFLQMHPKIRLGEIDPAENLGVLLIEFFELYGHFFNYNTTGINLNNGGTYFQKRQKGWSDLSKPWLLSIADPTDETNDVSRGSYQMLRLRKTLAGAALILTTRLMEVKEEMDAMNRGHYFSLRPGQQDSSVRTVLGKLVAMSPEAIRQRAAINTAYRSGHLQALLKVSPPSPLESSDRSDMQVSDKEEGEIQSQRFHYNMTDGSEAEFQATGSGTDQESKYSRRKRWKPNLVEHYVSELSEEDNSEGENHVAKRQHLDNSDDDKPQAKEKKDSKRSYWAGKSGLEG